MDYAMTNEIDERVDMTTADFLDGMAEDARKRAGGRARGARRMTSWRYPTRPRVRHRIRVRHRPIPPRCFIEIPSGGERTEDEFD